MWFRPEIRDKPLVPAGKQPASHANAVFYKSAQQLGHKPI
jgi:hypothetical protein